jgi:CheY-like chemotaxis protein
MKSRILVADDDDALRYSLRPFLEGLGYEVAEASDGVEALRAVHSDPPDLLILDVIMAPVSGWEVLYLLHTDERTGTLPVVLLTALAEARDEARGWFLGCDWYQVKEKPLNFDDLALVIERLLAVDQEEARRVWEASQGQGDASGQ